MSDEQTSVCMQRTELDARGSCIGSPSCHHRSTWTWPRWLTGRTVPGGCNEEFARFDSSSTQGRWREDNRGRVFLRIAHTFDAAATFAAPFLTSLSRSSVDLPVGAIGDGERARSARGQQGRGLWVVLCKRVGLRRFQPTLVLLQDGAGCFLDIERIVDAGHGSLQRRLGLQWSQGGNWAVKKTRCTADRARHTMILAGYSPLVPARAPERYAPDALACGIICRLDHRVHMVQSRLHEKVPECPVIGRGLLYMTVKRENPASHGRAGGYEGKGGRGGGEGGAPGLGSR